MGKEDKCIINSAKVIDIDEKRKSDFSIFDSIAEEKRWMQRVEEECLIECIKEVENL